MKRAQAILVLSAIFWQSAVSADVIETKSQGIMNGKRLSETADQVVFQDAKGKEHIFRKSEILFFVEEENIVQKPSPTQAKVQGLMDAAKKMKEKILETGAVWMKKAEKWTRKLSKPLDRSVADSKGDAMAQYLEEASQATVDMSEKNMAVNQEIKTQSSYLDSLSSTSKTKETNDTHSPH